MHTSSGTNPETRRVIILRLRYGRDPEVLLEAKGIKRTLFQLRIGNSSRLADQLTTQVKETCGIDVVSVHFAESLCSKSGTLEGYEVLEARNAQVAAPPGREWVAVHSLAKSSFRDAKDFDAVGRAVEATAPSQSSRGPFSSLGWFQLVEQWVQKEIRVYGLHLTGSYRQFNAYPTFSLIRFETDGPAVWFKAVGEPNHREYSITVALAHLCCPFVPAFICAQPEWHGWLAFEAPGTLLAENSDPLIWVRAAHDLADLQIQSIGASEPLLDANAHDLRPAAMRSRLEPFFAYMVTAMEQQAKSAPPVLSCQQLQELSREITEGIAALDQTGFPLSLGHLDLNPENIICSSTNIVFLDWAEGFVGHPFLTFQYYLETFRRRFGIRHANESQIADSYCSSWRAIISDQSIRAALEAAPLVAAFAYATANESWHNPRVVNEQDPSPYMRSLTRRMAREARLFSERRLACPW